jgi:SAM-dependent methyltransferase
MESRSFFDPLHNLHQMAALISEITGDSPSRVIERLECERLHPGRTVADEFSKCGGQRYKWGPHVEAFYASTSGFLYELAVWSRNSAKSAMRRWTTRHMAAGQRSLDVLCVGDGLGFDCLHLARKGHRLTYFERDGLSERFARKLFERSGCEVPVLTDPSLIGRESFDAITCFDVLEHVQHPPEMVTSMAGWLRPGDFMYVSAPFYMILPWYPTHLRSNRRFSGSLRLYREAGLQLAGGGRFTWYPIVLQKPDPAAVTSRFSFRSVAAQLTAGIQMVGQHVAWPFFPVHLLRRMCNRRFEAR